MNMSFIFPTLILSLFFASDLANGATECQCGLLNIQGRISNGHVSQKSKYPWLAYIRNYKFPENPKLYEYCGGSLIDDQHVLTAAHCVFQNKTINPESIRVYLGVFDKEADIAQNQPLKAEKIHYHPWYRRETLEYDIAVIKLTAKVNITKNISPVCLPENEDLSKFKKHEPLTIAGWGYVDVKTSPNTLNEAEILFIDYDRCDQFYRHKFGPNRKVSRTSFCAKGRDKVGVCPGDSGSPILHTDPDSGRMVAVGLTGFIFGKCGHMANAPNAFTRVGLFTKMIKEAAPNACFVPVRA
ncbi:clotting factor G beta subunit-like [Brevipalpus obovatus]|uniref:clotting factor G beta subunit-like n=1 Tax=Brevipalpus obovatus TaxID=246614 RepID=UPI003D9DB997